MSCRKYQSGEGGREGREGGSTVYKFHRFGDGGIVLPGGAH